MSRFRLSVLFGGFRDDTLTGSAVRDVMFGFWGSDSLDGLAGRDVLFGGFGNDVLRGGLGDDRLFGGFGDDTAVFDGGVQDYTVQTRGARVDVTGADGRDMLFRMEQLYFAADDYTAFLDGRNSGVLARDDTVATTENAATVFGVTGNDFDFDGDTLTVVAVDDSGTRGQVTLNDDGTISFDPGTAFDSLKEGETATTTFDYTVVDGKGASATATVTITVTGENDATVLDVPDAVTIDENTTAVTRAIVSDPDGDEITLSLSGDDAALFAIDANGVLTFRDAPDFEAPRDLDGDNTYELTIDGQGTFDFVSQAVSVTVADVLEIPDVEGRINEVHYDNAGADTGEFIEVRVRAGDDVSLLVLTLYNGSNGTSYARAAVGDGVKTTDGTYDYYVLDIATLGTSGIQNGAPDGMALTNGGLFLEFLSYEGTLTAVDGPVAGETSTDIGVFEPGSTPIGQSLQRQPDGSWADVQDETKGAENTIPLAQLVISEIMQNPSVVSDSNGEYFEIYNAGPGPVDLNGYIVSDADVDSFVIDNGRPLIVPAGGYIVLGNNADLATNGGVPVDYEYSGMFLSNGADEIIITDTLGREVDRVDYDGGPAFPDPNGASMELKGLTLDNNDGANWQTATAPFGAGGFGTPGAENTPPPTPLANVVITEVMQNPSAVFDSAGEWFEIYNAGDAPIDINGWTVSDNDRDSFVIDNGGPLEIPAGGYLVLGNNADSATNGGVTVDYEYSGMFLSNGADELVLTDTLAREVDRIEWDGGATWPDPNGASMSLLDPSLDNNVGANWTTATDPFGDGDLGTPGAANFAPPALVISEIMQNPSAVFDSAGEWFEIHNPGTADVDINGWTVRDNDSDSFVIDNGGPLVIPAGGYVVLGNNADMGTNGGVPVDYQYSGMFLSNGADELVLLTPEGAEVDRVEWDGGPAFPDPNGASMSLTDLAADNNVGANWTTATVAYGDGDLGTPGLDNGSVPPPPPPATDQLISAVQGAGDASSFVGQEVKVSAIVTAVVSNGFYLQEEDTDADADPLTSEGIFVFTGSTPTVVIGDGVNVTGLVDEFFDATQIDTVSLIEIFSVGNALPTAANLSLPDSISMLETYEGMRVSLASGPDDPPLTIIENFNFDRFGELVVSEGVQIQPTQLFDPNTEAASVAALAEANALNRITIDDGFGGQNPTSFSYIANTSAGDDGDGILSAGDTFTADGPTVRLGAEITGSIDGVLSFSFGEYKIIPTETLNIDPATNEGARDATPPDVGGELKVVSFNALNYFTTLGERGAFTPEDLARQETKLINALEALDADIIGLQEIENNGFGPDSAIASLVDALNARTGGNYAFVDPTTDGGPIGTDAISTGFIYNADAVTVTGSDFLIFDDGAQQRNRPAIAATFEDANGEQVTIAVNHFKSKGPSGLTAGDTSNPDSDQGDGQGFWNFTRAQAAQQLADWLATDPTGSGDPDYLVIGDLNAYAQEDPLTTLQNAGYTDLLAQFVGVADAFSFVFDGQQGALDHALASGSLAGQVTGVAEWHINAQEPDLLDYSSRFNDAGFFNGDDPYRASDHDPLILGLTLQDISLV